MILFYSPNDAYGPFSNFSRHTVTVFDRKWPTSEHPFQAWKFHPHRPDLIDLIHAAATPGKAAKLGRDRSHPLRGDWNQHPPIEMMTRLHGVEQPEDGVHRPGVTAEPLFKRVKDVVMYDVVLAKFSQHEELKKLLLETGSQPLIEDAEHDPYWGWGASRVGENKLGRILMAVRGQLQP